MYEELYELVKANEMKGDFTHAEVDDILLMEAEKELDLQIPEAFKWFLKNFGHGGIGGIEILGVGKNSKALFVSETLKFRAYGLPQELIIVENCDERVYCINSKDGTIVMWSQGDKSYKTSYDNFIDYLMDRINDILENM